MTSSIRKKIKERIAAVALLSVELLVIWILFFACIIIFAWMAYRVFLLRKQDMDTSVFNFMANHVSGRNTEIMEIITFFGSPEFLFPANILLIVYFLFIKKHKWYSIKIPVVAIGGVSMMVLLKYIFSRPRPLIPLLEPARGFSFPSGHAMMSAAFFGLLIYLVYKSVRNPYAKWSLIFLFVILILLIGLSRVYLRVHYASDVIAGFASAFIWIVLSISIMGKIENFSRRKIDPELENKEAA